MRTRFFRRLTSLTDEAAQHLASVGYDEEMAFAAVVGPPERERVVASSCYYLDPGTGPRRRRVPRRSRVAGRRAGRAAPRADGRVRAGSRRPRLRRRRPLVERGDAEGLPAGRARDEGRAGRRALEVEMLFDVAAAAARRRIAARWRSTGVRSRTRSTPRGVPLARLAGGMGAAGGGGARAGAVRLHRGRCRLRVDDPGEPGGVRAVPAAPADAAWERRAEPRGRGARDAVAAALLPRAGRRPLDRASRGRARRRAGRGRAGRSLRPLHRGLALARGGGRGGGPGAALVPALLGPRPGDHREPRPARGRRRLLRDRRHPRHADARLAAARPSATPTSRS